MRIFAGILTVLMVVAGIIEAEEIEIKGEIVEVEEIPCPSGNLNILKLQVRTQQREMVEAHLGPAWFLDTELKNEDEITITGKFNEENKFMVREMLRDTIRYRVRGEDYEPLWLRTRLQARNFCYNPLNEKKIKGKIENLYIYEKCVIMEAEVKLENGETVRVRFAPEWYLRNKFRLGDELELRGSEVRTNGQIMILAREMRNLRTKTEMTLRNKQGFPEWRRSRMGDRVGTSHPYGGKKPGHGKK